MSHDTPGGMPSCRLYGIRNCDSVRKALSWLQAQGVTCEFVDYARPGVAAARLPEWNRLVGWEILLNRRGLGWRNLEPSQREGVDEARALALMSSHPKLIKRPVLEVQGQILVGFDPQTWQAALA